MKKPEKKDYMGEICIKRFDPTINSAKIEYLGKGYNQACEEYEAYIKENYIKKPSVEKIVKLIDQCFKIELISNTSLRKNYLEIRDRLAKIIIEEIKGE